MGKGVEVLTNSDAGEAEKKAAMPETRSESYREHLVKARQKAYYDFDKAVFALSGGALAVTITFVDKVIGESAISSHLLLYLAWTFWSTSLAVVLISHYLSMLALTRALVQENASEDKDAPDQGAPGGIYTRLTEIANAAGGVLFLVGLVFILFFVGQNLEVRAMAKRDTAIYRPVAKKMVLPNTEIVKEGYTPPPPPIPKKKGYTPPPPPKPKPAAPTSDQGK